MNGSPLLSDVQKSLVDRRLPMTVQEVVRLVNDTRTSVARLAAAVSKHHVLAESVLRRANMSVYGVPGRVRNLNSAVVVLGLDALKETSRGVLVAYAGRKITDIVVKNLEIWDHSMGCAVIARFLALRSGVCHPDDAFVAGLLHDIGALFAPDRKQAMDGSLAMGDALTTARPLLEDVERFPHAHLGADLAVKWGVAEDVTEAVRFHHFPRLSKRNAPLTGIVYLAEFLCHQLRVGGAEYEQMDTVDREIAAGLGQPSSAEEFMALFDAFDGRPAQLPSTLDQTVSELKRRLFDTLDRLPDQQRLIVALHYFEGLSAAEIGLVLELPAPVAGAHLSTALTTLRQALKLST